MQEIDKNENKPINEEKKEKIKRWFKDRHNLIFFGIMIFAIVIRLYYFFLTKNQPLWWDESDYMAYAKNIAGLNTSWIVTPEHNSLFPYIAAFFFKINLSEYFMKFLLELVPSILLVFLTYKICILMYKDKRIALISSFLMAVLWEMLFDSFRFHIDNPALLFGLLSIYVFWKGYEKKEKIFGKIDPKLTMILTGLFILLSYSLRRAYLIFGLFLLSYLILTRKINSLIKDKNNWLALAIIIIIFLVIENNLFISKISDVGSIYYQEKGSINFKDSLTIFGVYFNSQGNGIINFLYYLFWIGFFIIIFSIFLSFDKFKKDESNEEIKSDLFNFLLISLTLLFFIFILRINFSEGRNYDPRWFFPLIFGSFVCISKGVLFVSDKIKNYNKLLSIAIILILIGYGGYYELQHADQTIKLKLNSFNGLKEASRYIKTISNNEDVILSVPIPQVIYYSDRKVIEPWRFLNKSSNQNTTLSEFLTRIGKNKEIKYILVTFSEPNHPDWMRKEEYIQNPQTGQLSYSKWMIPFMNTTINFINNDQDIKQEISYGNVKFKLLIIKEDVFVYEIIRLT